MKHKTHLQEWIPAILAIAIIVMSSFVSIAIMIWPIPETNETLIGQIQGSLWTAVAMLLNHYFGTTKNNQAKDETINTLAQTTQVAQQTPVVPATPAVSVPPGESVIVRAEEESTQ